jgi:hypothetical protein
MTAVKIAVVTTLVSTGLFAAVIAIGISVPRAYDGTRLASFSDAHVKFVHFMRRPRRLPTRVPHTEIIGRGLVTGGQFDPWIAIVESDQNLRRGVELVGATFPTKHRFIIAK